MIYVIYVILANDLPFAAVTDERFCYSEVDRLNGEELKFLQEREYMSGRRRIYYHAVKVPVNPEKVVCKWA